jgi:hypothetical protein
MHPLQKLMAKKKQEGKKLSPMEKKGKEDTLQSLIDDMMDMDGDKVKGLKKVTVASNSPKGLSKGLEKAKELIGEAPTGGLEDEEMPEGEEMMEEESSEDESEESPEMEESEHEEEGSESPEELEAEIEKLKEKLAKLKK